MYIDGCKIFHNNVSFNYFSSNTYFIYGSTFKILIINYHYSDNFSIRSSQGQAGTPSKTKTFHQYELESTYGIYLKRETRVFILPKEEKGIKIMKITPGWQKQNMRNLLSTQVMPM